MFRTALIICVVACATPALACKPYLIGCETDGERIAKAIDRQTEAINEQSYRASRNAIIESMDRNYNEWQNADSISRSIDYQTLINRPPY